MTETETQEPEAESVSEEETSEPETVIEENETVAEPEVSEVDSEAEAIEETVAEEAIEQPEETDGEEVLSPEEEFETAEDELLNAEPEDGKYQLWLGTVQVTEANCNNILKKTKNGKPTASFDPKTDTLTLNDPEITEINNQGNAVIHARGMNLVVTGTATFKSITNVREDQKDINGIYVRDGSLTVSGKDTAIDIEVKDIGLMAVGEPVENSILTVSDATLKINSKELMGIYTVHAVFKNVVMNVATKSTGIITFGNLTVNGGYIQALTSEEELAGCIGAAGTFKLSNAVITVPEEGALTKKGDLTYVAMPDEDKSPAQNVIIARQFAATFHSNYTNGPKDRVQNWIYNEETTLNANKFTRKGYTFTGWNTKADGKGTRYADQAKIPVNRSLELYAQWKPINYSITCKLNGGTVSKKNPASYNAETASFTLNNPTKK